MAWFKRRQQTRPSTPETPVQADGWLTFMTPEAADQFRAMAGEAFSALGLPVTIHPDHAADGSHRQFGFWNLAAQCAEVDPSEWRGLIDKHIRVVLESIDSPSPFAGLDQAEASYRTYARLYEQAFIPPSHLDKYPHREFAPGIIEMLALDLPDTVALYNHDNATALGGFEALRASGVANLQRLAVERLERLQTPEQSAFYALLGESVYTGSRALLLPGLATSLTGEDPTDYGWLMSVPNRHQVTWHVITDIAVLQVVGAMHHFASRGYQDAPSPVSPHVFWWNGTEYEQLTHPAEDGAVNVRPSARFQAVLERLAEARNP